MKFLKLLFSLLVILISCPAFAQNIPSDSMIIDVVTNSMQLSAAPIVAQATKWLSAFMMAQYVITNYKLLTTGGEIDHAIAKFTGSVLWFCFCWYLMNEGPGFINSVGNQFFRDYAPNIPSPSGIILTTIGTSTALLVLSAAIGAANTVLGQAVLLITLSVLGIGMYFAIKLFLLQLELGIIVMMAPFNFAFLGLNALKDNGIAPFKSLMSLAFRIVLYGIIFGAFSQVGNAMALVAQKYSSGDLGNLVDLVKSGATILKLLVSGLIAYAILFGLLFKSDPIAANLASGSTNLSASDVTGAAMAGAAAGSYVNQMAGAVSGAAGKLPQSMSDFMQNLRGNAEVKNVSDIGSGGVNSAALKPDSPNMSMGGSSNGGGSTQPYADKKSPDSNEKPGPLGNGTPNPLPDQNQRDSERDAAREARRQARTGKGSEDSTSKGLGDKAATRGTTSTGPRLGQHFSDLHQHLTQDKASPNVSINMHHD